MTDIRRKTLVAVQGLVCAIAFGLALTAVWPGDIFELTIAAIGLAFSLN